jgi:hypothetical protein
VALEPTLHMDLGQNMWVCIFARRFDLGERPDMRVMGTSPRERFNEMHMKVTSDGGEAERLNTLSRGLPASCGVTKREAQSGRIGNEASRLVISSHSK